MRLAALLLGRLRARVRGDQLAETLPQARNRLHGRGATLPSPRRRRVRPRVRVLAAVPRHRGHGPWVCLTARPLARRGCADILAEAARGDLGGRPRRLMLPLPLRRRRLMWLRLLPGQCAS
eukprot:365252-Chlamydomonas_euryale.AAC.3